MTSSPTSILSNGHIAENLPVPFSNRNGSEDMEAEYLNYLISGLASNNTIIIVSINKALIRVGLNLNCRMRQLGMNNVLWWALDESAHAMLTAYQIPSYFNPAFIQMETFEQGSNIYLDMMATRFSFWRSVIRTGHNMFFMDVDVVIYRNPLLDLAWDADLEGQVDEFEYEEAVDEFRYPHMCAGAFLLKPNNRSIRFLDDMEKAYTGIEHIFNDQVAMNHVLHHIDNNIVLNRYDRGPDGEKISKGKSSKETKEKQDDRLTVRFIPIDKFVNGHIWRGEVETERDGRHMKFVQSGTREVIQEFEPALLHLNGDHDKEFRFKYFPWWQLRDDLSCPLDRDLKRT
jgi:hypothetical protein